MGVTSNTAAPIKSGGAMLLACVHDRRVGHQRRQWRQVIIWSNEAATFDGAIFAEDGVQAGNGGFVETSEHALTFMRNPVQRGHRFQRKADSNPVIADSR